MATAKTTKPKIGKQKNTTRTYFASWAFSTKGSGKKMKKHVAEYAYAWYYYTTDKKAKSLSTKKWFEGSSGTTKQLKCTYDPPDNAEAIRVTVRPVSKTHTVKKGNNTKEVKYFSGKTQTSTNTKISRVVPSADTKPATPSTPTCTVSGTKLTASVDNITDKNTTEIRFYIVENDTKQTKQTDGSIVYGKVSITYTIKTGKVYKVRCQAYNKKTKEWSEYSSYSSDLRTAPSTPKITKRTVISATELRIQFTSATSATSYIVEYTTNKAYFDTSSEVKSITVTTTTASLTGLTSGTKYYVRVKASNDQGDSSWSNIIEQVVGTAPAAPTTWSEVDSATAGDVVRLFWVHNSEDGSAETSANLSLTFINSEDAVVYTTTKTITPTSTQTSEIGMYELDTNSAECSQYCTAGIKIKWKVRTKGAFPSFGPYSTERIVDIYEKPSIESGIYEQPTKDQDPVEVVTAFPFYLISEIAPLTQHVTSFAIEVKAKQGYDPANAIGQRIHVSEDEIIFTNQQYYNSEDEINTINFEFNAGNIDLEPGQSYVIHQIASLDSGLTAEDDYEIEVSWTDQNYYPDASEISWNEDNYTVSLQPFCVVVEPDEYDPDTPAVDPGDAEDDFDDDNDDGYEITPETLAPNVTLSVYRIDYDGRFVPIELDIDNDLGTVVVDKFPPLNEARYRIVARDNTTGAISYNDTEPVVTGEPSIIIQWNIGNFGQANLATYEESPDGETYSLIDSEADLGITLRLPYNVDVADSYSPDVSLVEYIGRSHPVSYYGTQLGVSGSWSTEIPYDDSETLQKLRELAAFQGDAYVREPSGVGYWAHVVPSFSIKHRELTIPITLAVTRVEG